MLGAGTALEEVATGVGAGVEVVVAVVGVEGGGEVEVEVEVEVVVVVVVVVLVDVGAGAGAGDAGLARSGLYKINIKYNDKRRKLPATHCAPLHCRRRRGVLASRK